MSFFTWLTIFSCLLKIWATGNTTVIQKRYNESRVCKDCQKFNKQWEKKEWRKLRNFCLISVEKPILLLAFPYFISIIRFKTFLQSSNIFITIQFRRYIIQNIINIAQLGYRKGMVGIDGWPFFSSFVLFGHSFPSLSYLFLCFSVAVQSSVLQKNELSPPPCLSQKDKQMGMQKRWLSKISCDARSSITWFCSVTAFLLVAHFHVKDLW